MEHVAPAESSTTIGNLGRMAKVNPGVGCDIKVVQKMKQVLLDQAGELRKIIEDQLRGRYNTHWEIGEALNHLREAALELLEPSDRSRFEQIVRPLEINKIGPFTVDSSNALRLCTQIISLLKDQNNSAQDSADENEELIRLIPPGKQVFIIHGHDSVNPLRLRAMLKERFGLAPIILSEKASKGRTIIEKFEMEAGESSFAFAILSPDDLIVSNNASYQQARPNVLFELGWFYGRLGRERVCILFQESTSIPSDLSGIGRITFSKSIEEKLGEIEAELESANLLRR